jgi:hypothetical protein
MLIDGVEQLLCAKACLHDDWKATGSTQLFLCRCGEVETLRRAPEHSKVESIACKRFLPAVEPVKAANKYRNCPVSPLCYPFRQAGDDMSWTLYKAMDRSSNRLVSVIIKDVAADGKQGLYRN